MMALLQGFGVFVQNIIQGLEISLIYCSLCWGQNILCVMKRSGATTGNWNKKPSRASTFIKDANLTIIKQVIEIISQYFTVFLW